MPPYATSGWLRAKPPPRSRAAGRNLNLVYTPVNEHIFLIQTLRPIRRMGQVRTADEAVRRLDDSLFDIEGSQVRFTPTFVYGSGGPHEADQRSLSRRLVDPQNVQLWTAKRAEVTRSKAAYKADTECQAWAV